MQHIDYIRHFLIGAAFTVTAYSCMAQRYAHLYPEYGFIDYQKNQLQFFGSNEPMKRFYQKLDTVIFEGENQVTILHIGGSHIQAGIWSAAVREAFHTLHPGLVAGRGLVFPYRAARTNNPADYTTEHSGGWEGCRNVEKTKMCSLGVLGISTTTERSDAWIRIVLKKNPLISYRFTSVRVYHSTDAQSYAFEFPNDPQAVIETHADQGYSRVYFTRPLDTLHLQLKQTDSLQQHFTCFGFSLETDKPGIYYHAVGVNGADVPAYLRSVNFARDLQATPPDLVIFSIGINDALYPSFSPQAYKENYHELIRRIKAVAPETAILFTTNNDSYFKRRYVNPNGEKVKQAMQELSAQLHAGVWDMYSIMGGRGSIDQWIAADLAKTDKLHFNGDGYRLLGYLLASAILQDYEKHLVTKAKR